MFITLAKLIVLMTQGCRPSLATRHTPCRPLATPSEHRKQPALVLHGTIDSWNFPKTLYFLSPPPIVIRAETGSALSTAGRVTGVTKRIPCTTNPCTTGSAAALCASWESGKWEYEVDDSSTSLEDGTVIGEPAAGMGRQWAYWSGAPMSQSLAGR
jgi:hypothetical protein